MPCCHAMASRGFILPAYFLQTAGRVMEYARRWSMEAELIPRNVYPDLSKPLVFTLFRKNAGRRMVGMAFYFEAAAVAQLPEGNQDAVLRAGCTPVAPRGRAGAHRPWRTRHPAADLPRGRGQPTLEHTLLARANT